MAKQILRKVDKPRTALKELKKQYSNVNSQYQRMKSDKGQFSDLAASGYDRDRRKIQKKIDAVQKVVDKKTKPNNKDLSKSLGSVASNKGMKKSDVKGTYNEQKRRAYNHYIESQTDYDGNGGVSTYNMTEYLKAKKAQKQMKSIEKTAKKQGVKLKK